MPSEPNGTSRVLCIFDDPALRVCVRAPLLAAGCQVVDATDVAHARERWAVQAPDVVVLQCALAGARELLEELAATGAAARIPLIAIGSAEDCVAAVRDGATDWIVTPVVGGLLVHRVAAVLLAARCERDLARVRDERPAGDAARTSSPGPRERFLQRVDAMLSPPRQRGDEAALLVLSIRVDEEASGADTLADCLPTMAERLSEVLSASGGASGSGVPMSRLEGCEFTVFLGHQERPGVAYQIARQLQLQLERPAELEGRPHVSAQVDIGIALLPHDGVRAVELHAAARRAMSRAREDQLQGIRFATGAMNSATFERQTMESSLRYALERGELTLYYQPRVEIASGRIVGLEALLRWQHPELGLVSPGHFISIAEESGLIVPIGEWVLREACRQNQAWRDAGLPAIRVAVNLSSVQFRQPDLEVRIAQVLEETGLEPGGLELELTESMLFQDAERTTETLRAIKEMGVHLSIDDFGTGYSSLSYVKRFPVHALKIDQSFVREMTTSPESSAITTSIVLMGKSLGLTVVAEGVETRSQLEFLRALECDEAQGYLFSRPVPAREAGELVGGTHARTGS
jgi:EAL domain-containing protein (putative c-di-GMP-specific phosphodiesterase class I)/GGDEF domain-containing protein/CheY-like chemotaxis protein